jgi:hypothetical protein
MAAKSHFTAVNEGPESGTSFSLVNVHNQGEIPSRGRVLLAGRDQVQSFRIDP